MLLGGWGVCDVVLGGGVCDVVLGGGGGVRWLCQSEGDVLLGVVMVVRHGLYMHTPLPLNEQLVLTESGIIAPIQNKHPMNISTQLDYNNYIRIISTLTRIDTLHE